MATRHDLKHSILSILKHNRDGSYTTQSDRKKRLMRIADELVDRGIQIRHIKQIKSKHVVRLVNDWLTNPLESGTIKNRLTDLRWMSEKINKRGLLPATNAELGIPKRILVSHMDKSTYLTNGDISRVSDPDLQMSLLLQKAFGLRRKECIKIKIHQAVVGNELRLKGSWCKNGRPRTIPILYPEQWEAIQQCKDYVGNINRALIPAGKSYKNQMQVYNKQLQRKGIQKAHGLRHAYAQRRYKDLTGWDCPVKGDLTKDQFTEEQKIKDLEARQILSKELGHNRVSIVSQYVGQ